VNQNSIESLENDLAALDGLIDQKKHDLCKIESELDQDVDLDDYEAVTRCTDKQRRYKKVNAEIHQLTLERNRINRQLERMGAYA